MLIPSLMCLSIRDFKQWKWIESIHLTRKYSAFSSSGNWNPVYLVLNSKTFYLLSYIFIWTPAPYYGLLLSFIHFASPNQLLPAPCFFQMHNPSVTLWNSKSWCHFCVFSSSFVSFILLATKHVKFQFREFLIFFYLVS